MCFIYANRLSAQACPFLSPWTSWSSCNVSCGAGMRARERICVNGAIGDVGCDEVVMETEMCEFLVSLR